MKDLHGQAILDYYKGIREQQLLLHTSYGEPEEMPVEVFFREHEDFSEIENLAISSGKGRVLDIGAGAGAHALFLQALEVDVVALENSPGCVEVLKMSGMNQVVSQDYQLHQGKYNTLLLLMNGIGIIGKKNKLSQFLKRARNLLNLGGQILFDSSDISYLYEEIDRPDHYLGEVQFRYEYKGNLGEWFDWVYIDQNTMKEMVEGEGLKLEVLHTDEYDQYLGRITGF